MSPEQTALIPEWLDAEGVDDEAPEEFSVDEYDLTATPNDFNVETIVGFIEKRVFKIPGFQRHYVWDIRRASKLIESIVMGLPVPQIFLYEEKKNEFLVVDGQQRLMSIYYFVQKRFPRPEKRGRLRTIFDRHGYLPAETLADDDIFLNFNLQLPSKLPHQHSKLDRLNYDTLGEYKTTLQLRTIRCVVIKQNNPKNDDSSVYEIFNRLNTGGVNLTPQEIRMSLYHSDFFQMLYRLNADPAWRKIIGAAEPDLRLRDIEILLRGFAMLLKSDEYSPSMTRFLNQFSKDMRAAKADDLQKLEALFRVFLEKSSQLPEGTFGRRSKKLNISVFEAVFAAVAAPAFKGLAPIPSLDATKIEELKADSKFAEAARNKSTDKSNVATRLSQARLILAS